MRLNGLQTNWSGKEKTMQSDAERHDRCVIQVKNSGLHEVGVRLRVLDIVWNMRDRASDSDRTGSGKKQPCQKHGVTDKEQSPAGGDHLSPDSMSGKTGDGTGAHDRKNSPIDREKRHPFTDLLMPAPEEENNDPHKDQRCDQMRR